ncbi:MAG: anthranilate synthase component I family protein [Desulfovibrio sp.]|jgi:anthranilate synthase component 1|nr:anthranilate synthase component I family protein [Desulfovibrio sp.]
MRIRLEQEYRLLENDVETPISLYLREVGNEQGILLESAEVDGRWGRYSIIAGNFLLRVGCRNGLLELASRDRRLNDLKRYDGLPFVEGLRKVMDALEIAPAGPGDLPPITRGLYGYFGYGMAGIFEPKLSVALPPADAECCLVLPGTLTLFDHQYNRLCRLSLASSPAGKTSRGDIAERPATVGKISATIEKGAYLRLVEDVRERIRQGEGIQVVPSVRFQAPFEGEPFTLYRRLRRINPSPYLFFMRLPGVTLMGSSPEVMVGCQGDALRLSPIAGTRPRGGSAGEDNLFEGELISDPKEQAEHVMLVDLGRNDLGRVATPGSVKLERYMEVERFSHVMHLTSYITATLAPGLDALDVLAAAFPAGTVTGAPKIRAMEIIAEVERQPRGPYGGAIGWLGLDKDGVHLDTGITIRSLWVRNGQVQWQAGGGVVFDSSPEAEWKECNNKAAAMRLVLAGSGAVS